MKIGDIQVYIGNTNQLYTKNKKYVIYKVSNNFIPGSVCGWIICDDGKSSVYFKESDSDRYWVDIKYYRREKLEKLKNYNE